MARFQYEGIWYEGEMEIPSPAGEPLRVRFVKHDIGTWSAHLVELGTWEQRDSLKEALAAVIIRCFGIKVEKKKPKT